MHCAISIASILAAVTFVCYSNRFRQGEVSFCRVNVVDWQTFFFIRYRLRPQSESQGNLTGADFLQRTGTGIFQVVAGIVIDTGQNGLRLFFTVFGNQSLYQQPRGRGGLEYLLRKDGLYKPDPPDP